MHILATDTITLVNVNDATSVSLSPSASIIHSDVSGNVFRLDSAYTYLSVRREKSSLPINVENIVLKSISDANIQYTLANVDAYTVKITIDSLPVQTLDGYMEFTISIDGYETDVIYQFTVEREASLLDWILDWESNKTSIGGDYILTPKIYAGQVDNVDGDLVITGVYMGPDTYGAGLYGYDEGNIIFQLNSNGGMIGGWEITQDGIISSSRKMNILSDGTISSVGENGLINWALYEDGNAVFAKNNIRFYADGSAYYKGEIEVGSGSIGGWEISDRAIYKAHVILDAAHSYIGVSPYELSGSELSDSSYLHKNSVISHGGVAMFYDTPMSYGLIGYLPKVNDVERKIFSIGSENYISGWIIKEDRLSTKYFAIVSGENASGIYLSDQELAEGDSHDALATTIKSGDGIYIQAKSGHTSMVGYVDGKAVFKVGSEGNFIGGWHFTDKSFYYGDSDKLVDGFSQIGGLIIGEGGIYANTWRLLADGSGSLANGNIIWEADGTTLIKGELSIENVNKISEKVFESIGGLEFGKYNLVRNSGFTGDFVTESLDGETVMDENNQLFSDPFRHWMHVNASIQNSEISESGKICMITNDGAIVQQLETNLIPGESYVLSFRAIGTSLQYSVGGITKDVPISRTWTRYVEKFVATSNSPALAFTKGRCNICEIQLERGNVVSAWGYNMRDNQSAYAKYQKLSYLESAIHNGETVVSGGLILANILMLGNHDSHGNTAGISGIFNDNIDVAFWCGGSYDQAVATVMKYDDDPFFVPTAEELAEMANVVITHGGRAILNDVIVRGTVYAEDGKFAGELQADSGRFGSLEIEYDEDRDEVWIVGNRTIFDDEEHTIRFSPEYFEMSVSRPDGRWIEAVKICPFPDFDRFDTDGTVEIWGRENRTALCIARGDISIHDGIVYGLTYPTEVITESGGFYNINKDITVYSPDDTGWPSSLKLPAPSKVGKVMHIINVRRAPIFIECEYSILVNVKTGDTGSSFDWADIETSQIPYKIEAYYANGSWMIIPFI